jgi:hypothetical protein
MSHRTFAVCRLLGGVSVLTILALTLAPAHAMFIKPNLEILPVARLIENMEQLVQKTPNDATLKFNLARVHAMAYALKADTTQVWKNQEKEGAWFGYTPKAVPFMPQKTDDMAKLKLAKEHLEKALKLYVEVMQIQPDNLAARLGHAWLVDQSGDKMKAIAEYRNVIDKAWAKEGQLKSGPLGGNFITVEAAGYLIPLLNKDNDAAEIKMLEQRTAQLKKLPQPITPVAIPLHDGLAPADLIDRHARVKFDADGTGPKDWTWISRHAAWLVHDPQHTQKVTSGLQLFGNVTFWLFWDNGYQALHALDNDGDGFLSGAELDGLALWHDANGNGLCDPGEVKSLRAWGITKISCQYLTGGPAPECAAWCPQGVWFRDGTVRPTYDLILRAW